MLNLSIQSRVNLLIGALLVLALATNVLVIIRSAGPRIGAENDSIMKLTRQTVGRAVIELQSSTDPGRDIAGLLDRLADVRHARTYYVPDGSNLATYITHAAADRRFPVWFARLIASDRPPVNVPVAVAGRPLGQISIVSTPADEIAEIWDAAKETAAGGLALIAVVYAVTTLAVRRALMPINNLGDALKSMEGGTYEVALATTGPPELAAISAKVNDLAAALTRTRLENRRLAEQMITLEDRERRELARELHDEFGPYLFAIRATMTALLARTEGDSTPLADEVRRRSDATLEHVSAVQQLNRRVLQRLRPPALAELGLEGALRSLIALSRERHPEVTVSLESHLGETALDETSQLTVYRVVQESVTNALRHAHASRIDVAVTATPDGQVNVRIADDGDGLGDEIRSGFGLSGMSERVWALGGTLITANGPAGGLTLEAHLPSAATVHSRLP